MLSLSSGSRIRSFPLFPREILTSLLKHRVSKLKERPITTVAKIWSLWIRRIFQPRRSGTVNPVPQTWPSLWFILKETKRVPLPYIRSVQTLAIPLLMQGHWCRIGPSGKLLLRTQDYTFSDDDEEDDDDKHAVFLYMCMLQGFFSLFFHCFCSFFSFVFSCVFFFISMDLRGLIQIKKETERKRKMLLLMMVVLKVVVKR